MRARWLQSWPDPLPPRRQHCIITALPKLIVRGPEYGCAIYNALQAEDDGLYMVEWDVAIDPLAMHVLEDAVALAPDDVHVGLYRLWFNNNWCWPHRTNGGTVWIKEPTDPVDAVAWGIIYFPAWLLYKLESCDYLDKLCYPGNDTAFSTFCREVGVPMHVVPECMGTHLHWDEDALPRGIQLYHGR